MKPVYSLSLVLMIVLVSSLVASCARPEIPASEPMIPAATAVAGEESGAEPAITPVEEEITVIKPSPTSGDEPDESDEPEEPAATDETGAPTAPALPGGTPTNIPTDEAETDEADEGEAVAAVEETDEIGEDTPAPPEATVETEDAELSETDVVTRTDRVTQTVEIETAEEATTPAGTPESAAEDADDETPTATPDAATAADEDTTTDEDAVVIPLYPGAQPISDNSPLSTFVSLVNQLVSQSQLQVTPEIDDYTLPANATVEDVQAFYSEEFTAQGWQETSLTDLIQADLPGSGVAWVNDVNEFFAILVIDAHMVVPTPILITVEGTQQ